MTGRHVNGQSSSNILDCSIKEPLAGTRTSPGALAQISQHLINAQQLADNIDIRAPCIVCCCVSSYFVLPHQAGFVIVIVCHSPKFDFGVPHRRK